MGRRTGSRRAGFVVPGARATLVANARKTLGFCTCDLAAPSEGPRCLPHANLAALEAGEPVVTSARAFSWAVPVPLALDDLGALVAVHADDLVTTPEDADL